jgi:hypothetical protein
MAFLIEARFSMNSAMPLKEHGVKTIKIEYSTAAGMAR